MIIVDINCGLGNQLFQYAFGRYLSIKHNTILKLDLKSFKTYSSYRNYQLNSFNIIENIASIDEVRKFKYQKPPFNKYIYYKLTGKKLGDKYFTKYSKNFISQKQYNFIPEMKELHDNIYLNGFWQSEKYFIEIQDVLKKEFQLKNPPNESNQKLLDKICSTNSVCLHLRRTDYLNNDFLNGICDLTYYKKATDYISQRVENPVFFVFSDDIEWSKENIKTGFETIFVDVNSEKNAYEDIRLMSNCKNNVIANSSFSWWGAWLNNNCDKIVITPKKWTNDNSIPIDDIACDGWIKI